MFWAQTPDCRFNVFERQQRKGTQKAAGADELRENKVEILAPAGSYDILMADFAAGADAVYLGGAMFGARAYANNLSQEELLRALDYAHLHDKKIYLTVNTLMKQQELEDRLLPYLEPFYKAGLSAVIVQDFGAFEAIKKHFRDCIFMRVHR